MKVFKLLALLGPVWLILIHAGAGKASAAEPPVQAGSIKHMIWVKARANKPTQYELSLTSARFGRQN